MKLPNVRRTGMKAYPYRVEVRFMEEKNGAIYEVIRSVVHYSPTKKVKARSSRLLGYVEHRRKNALR
jgi:hypothetical protein